MTPSLPTFCMALARKLPISVSPLAEMVPTWAISSFEVTFLELALRCSTMASTARSTPRFKSIGFMPAATALEPSFTIACASTVAVVVPSPATSEALEATSRTICAPMFSNLSSSSISFATVTPSLVMRGAPKILSSTTLRPLGPSVTRTALARMSTPRSIRSRASVENLTSLAAIVVIPLMSVGKALGGLLRATLEPSSTPMMSLSFMINSSSPSILTSVPDHLPNSTRSPTFTSIGVSLPASSRPPGPTATISPWLGFSCAVSGMMMPEAVFSSASTRLTTTRS